MGEDEDMTATDELRRLLDERGVEYETDDTQVSDTEWYYVTKLRDGRNDRWTYEEPPGCDLLVSYQYDLGAEDAIAATLGPVITGDTSDGYHTFNELYHHRAVLFSVIVRDHANLAWKSRVHHDGTMYDGMFIVGIETPQGQATYHYEIDPYWDMFKCKELDRAPEWDGHTPDDAIARIAPLGDVDATCERHGDARTCRKLPPDNGMTCIVRSRGYEMEFGYWKCSECGANCFEGARYCMKCGAKVVDE